MAYRSQYSSLLSLLFALGLLLAIANEGVAGRSVPNVDSKKVDKKQPEWLVDHNDGTVLIPGFGRVILPHGHGDNHGLKSYNPITGTYSPHPITSGIHVPSIGGGTRRSYVPGNDDTFIPNPGFEVPIPGGGIPAPNTRDIP